MEITVMVITIANIQINPIVSKRNEVFYDSYILNPYYKLPKSSSHSIKCLHPKPNQHRGFVVQHCCFVVHRYCFAKQR